MIHRHFARLVRAHAQRIKFFPGKARVSAYRTHFIITMQYVLFVFVIVLYSTLALSEDPSEEKIEGEIDANEREFKICILPYTDAYNKKVQLLT